MTVQIVKWGNSQGIRIPRGILADAGLAVGSHADLYLENGRIVIEKLSSVHKTLEERAAAYGGKLGPYDEKDWGEPVGKEVW